MTAPTSGPFKGLDLPQVVFDNVKNRAIERVILAVLRRGFGDSVECFSLVPRLTPSYFVLVRGVAEAGLYRGVPGLYHGADFVVNTYAEDPNGDEKGQLLGDAVVGILHRAWQEHWDFPNLGSINKIRCDQYPARVTDWQTSSGPVQYADLPAGDWRYEARFSAVINTPRVLAD